MIRQASRADLERMEQLWLYSVITAHPSVPRHYWQSRLGDFRRRCKVSECSLVYTAGKHRSADGFAAVDRDGALTFLCVTPSEAGHGIGSALMEAVKRSQPQLEARLLQENLLGRYFLQQHGFVETERQPNPAAGQAEILMSYSAANDPAPRGAQAPRM
ncbi:GNAT family N-acetyltransferase [Microbulbifer hainanensis]|uniref:GNAT family N-acetyltransferase n=1 Tax=Microbulbifer hainanensis TaxID=2735675 RepID=UPI001866914A|nr:GNAT family N-acetyltransferase [Microbulbifer hainanensis]